MTVQSIPYPEALRLILAAEAANDHPPAISAELPAIISHWLQDPASCPIRFDKGIAQKWTKLLNMYLNSTDPFPVSRQAQAGRVEKIIDYSGVPFLPPSKPKFRFIDLFAGIGGFRIALQQLGGKCVFSSEWDLNAKRTYFANFGEVPFGDIRSFTGEEVSDKAIDALVPDHDVLAAGFPCQPFSRAGVSARSSLGHKHGFSCEIQGTLFFDLMRITKVKKPKVLFLENVKNLEQHDSGRTMERIRKTIEKDLGYSFNYAIIDASPLVPQRRKRCYMVCLRDKRTFDFPAIDGQPLPLEQVLEDNPPQKYTLSDKMWQGHIKRTNRNLARGAGFTAFEADLKKPANTLVARYYKDGKECLVPQANKNPRLLTPLECARLQGYPKEFIVHPVDTHAYRQFGNSVAVPVVMRIASDVVRFMRRD